MFKFSYIFNGIGLLLISFLLTACHFSHPTIHLTSTNGQSYFIPDAKKRWVYLHFWAPWCSTCKAEAPALNLFYQKEKDKAILLGIDFDSNELNQLKVSSQAFGFLFPIIIKNPTETYPESFKDITIIGLPSTVIFNPEGQWVTTLVGAQTYESLVQVMKNNPDAKI